MSEPELRPLREATNATPVGALSSSGRLEGKPGATGVGVGAVDVGAWGRGGVAAGAARGMGQGRMGCLWLLLGGTPGQRGGKLPVIRQLLQQLRNMCPRRRLGRNDPTSTTC